MTTQAILALVVFVAAIVLLIWKPLHPIVIGASIPTALALLGILDANRAFADFANSTVIFFMSLLVIGAAIFKTGLADFIGEKIIGLIGKKEKSIMLGTGVVAAGLSGFLNDTGTTGCLIPIVSSISQKSKVPISKILMALAFFASLGGTLTLIGTTPHIVANGLLIEAGYEGFGFFEFAPIGLPIIIAGLIYMYFFGMKLLPIKDMANVKMPELAEKDPKKMIVVSIVFIFIIYCMASGLFPMHLAAALGAILVVLTKCITVEEAIDSFSVTTLFLVAGIFPLSTALIETGAADYIITSISPILTNLSPLVIYAAIAGITIVLTQFLMNTSLTAILVPMSIIIAESAGVDPRAVVMVIAMASSAAFCTPFGTGPNLLVWEIGGYEFKDYAKIGIPLAIVFWIITVAGVAIMYGF